ncbi:Kynurenine formamidase [Rhizophlyctis rosea]|nr:Kynurenine formamidase [Rhizophlyctis rosea]
MIDTTQQNVTIRKDIQYAGGTDPKQTYDAYVPTSLPNNNIRPLLVYVHGGAWRTGDKSDYTYLGTHFASHHKIPTLIPSYRLSPTVSHPSHLRDIALSISHYIHTSPTPPTLLLLSGHSAGGHITGLLTLLPEHLNEADSIIHSTLHPKTPIQCYTLLTATIGIQGIYSLPNLLALWPSYSSFITPAFGPDTSLYPSLSPTHVHPSPLTNHSTLHPHLPPYLLIHSPNDELVDLGQTRDYAVRLKALGADVKVVSDGLIGTHFGVLKEERFLDVVAEFVKEQCAKAK